MAQTVTIREHRIPTAGSAPYICVEGPDRCLWFCESGAAKIGRFDPATGAFTEFPLPTPDSTPIGIGRITPKGEVSEFSAGITPGSRPLSIVVRDGALWFSEAAGNRIGRITLDGTVTEFPIPSPDSQPRAMVAHPDGSIWFVETSTNALGRIDRDGVITEHRVPTPDASLRGVTVAPDGLLWFTENAANQIGCMAPDGRMVREYPIPTPASGARCIAPVTDGRLFFTQFDAGLIGEVVVRMRLGEWPVAWAKSVAEESNNAPLPTPRAPA